MKLNTGNILLKPYRILLQLRSKIEFVKNKNDI